MSIKISAFPAAISFDATDVLLGNVGGVTKKIARSVLESFLYGGSSGTGNVARVGSEPQFTNGIKLTGGNLGLPGGCYLYWGDTNHYINAGGSMAIVDVNGVAVTTPTFSITGTSTLTGGAIMGAPLRKKGYTVATLPAGTQGDEAYVTDALLPAFLATVAGGGAVVTPVFYDGTDWKAV